MQTTLSARVEPREEGKRHWTHRTEITSIGNLERAIGGGQKDDQDLVRPESTQSGGKAGVTGTAKSSATLRATNTTSDSRTVDRNYDTDMDTDDEDELSQITDSAIKSAAAAMRQESLQTPSLGSKRKRNVADSVYDNDDLFGDMDSDEERQLAAIADSTGQTTRKRDVFVTPAAQRTNDVATGMPTPSLTKESVRRVLFAERETGEASSTKRQCNDHADAYTSAGESTSPSSSQEADGVPSSPPTPGTGIGNLAHEVMELLRGQNIDNATLRNVRTSLDTYAAKAIGLERGRDATREALKQKDGKIAQLQMRVTALENTRKVDLAEKKKLKSGLMHLYSQT